MGCETFRSDGMEHRLELMEKGYLDWVGPLLLLYLAS